MFDIEEKVAIVTGGASGIGLSVTRKLLENGAKGVTIADINEETGKQVADELKQEFGQNRVIFQKTDVSNKNSLEDTFKRTLETFKHIDILLNNAGIYDDRNYELEVAINFTGVVHGTTLGIQKYIQPGGVIVNTASITGTRVYPSMPIYGAIKSGVVSLTMALGDEVHYQRTKVRVIAIAPGFTTTSLCQNLSLKGLSLDDGFGQVLEDETVYYIEQPADLVGENIIKIIKEKPSGTVWISEDSKDIFEYIPSRPTYRPT